MCNITIYRVWESYTYTQMFTVVLPVCQVRVARARTCSLVTVCPQMALTASTYLTLAVAVERYTTVCHPFFKVTVTLITAAAAAK